MTHEKQIKGVFAALLVACSALAGCVGDGCPKPRNIAAAKLLKKGAAPDGPPAANQLVVYLDTSASMEGYVTNGSDEETTYSRTLRELRNFVTLVNPPLDVSVRRVDAKVGEPLNDMTLSKASVERKFFNGANTDLAGAFDTLPAAADGDGHPARFHVLVTDGVQSTSQQRPDLACTSGSDQLCVRKKILNLLNSGWGGCVIALRGEFHGNLYSEVNRARSRPSVLRFDSVAGQPETYRPFYLYVFSPDRAAVEQFVSTLVGRLKPLVGERGDSLRVLPLTFQYTDGEAKAEPFVPDSSKRLLVVRMEESKGMPEFTVSVDPSTAQAGPQPFTLLFDVPWTPDIRLSGTARELSELIRWELVPVYPETPSGTSRYPEVKIVNTSVADNGRIALQATAIWPAAVGSLCWRGYRLEGRLRPEALTPQWVSAWSADLDTTTATATQTLYLESGLLGLWRNPVLNDQLVAEASVLVGKR
jgi:hypothetical protein